jgi:hypothetical protein
VSEIECAQSITANEPIGCSMFDDFAACHQVDPVGHGQRQSGVLLDQQDTLMFAISSCRRGHSLLT